MPAELAPHEATWIAWPHNAEDWPGKFQPIPWVYSEIVRHLSRVEDVNILVNDLPAEKRATQLLRRAGANMARLHFHHWATDRVWLRDSGPIFVKNVAKLYAMPEFRPEVELEIGEMHRLVLEGGSIDTNGAGILLTTEECLLSEVQQRNPGVSREQLEAAFAEYLGIEKVLWMHRGCAGDDTHGHIDDVTRFVGENTILTAVEKNTADENHLPLAESERRRV
jgi:agmatine deiminase